MAVARCAVCGQPTGKRRNYTQSRAPFYPSQFDVICPAPNCSRHAFIIWLTDEEEKEYLRGERIFRLPGRPGGVQVI